MTAARRGDHHGPEHDGHVHPHHLKPGAGGGGGGDAGAGTRLSVTPDTVGWEFVSFAVHEVGGGGNPDAHHVELADRELAIVPLSGAAEITAGGETWTVSRASVFTEMPHVAYAPPGTPVTVRAAGGAGAGTNPFTFALGSAPAEGRYPARLFAPEEMKRELRGGGQSYRQVHHVLAMPLPAERLILYEVYIPRGTWAAWAPHRHDGREGSPYLEEVYYFRIDRPEGFVLQRNWSELDDFDETFVVGDGDAVAVTKGYHVTVACPSANLYFLNYLAGELVGDDRITPPCFHADHVWIHDDWDTGAWKLPIIAPL